MNFKNFKSKTNCTFFNLSSITIRIGEIIRISNLIVKGSKLKVK